jgi:hypothetical protein
MPCWARATAKRRTRIAARRATTRMEETDCDLFYKYVLDAVDDHGGWLRTILQVVLLPVRYVVSRQNPFAADKIAGPHRVVSRSAATRPVNESVWLLLSAMTTAEAQSTPPLARLSSTSVGRLRSAEQSRLLSLPANCLLQHFLRVASTDLPLAGWICDSRVPLQAHAKNALRSLICLNDIALGVYCAAHLDQEAVYCCSAVFGQRLCHAWSELENVKKYKMAI